MRITVSLLIAVVLSIGVRGVAIARGGGVLGQDDDFKVTGCIQKEADNQFSLRTTGGDEFGLIAAGGVSFAEHVDHTVTVTAQIVSVNSDGDPDQIRVTKLQMVGRGCR